MRLLITADFSAYYLRQTGPHTGGLFSATLNT